MKAKKETVKELVDLMMNIQNWHFKSRLVPGHPRICESSRNELCISIDLYNFEGDGKPVCEGLNPCEVTLDDGTKDIGWLYCMCYNPDDEKMPLVFLFTPDEEQGRTHGDRDITPENVPEEVLQNILKWLGEELKKGSEDVENIRTIMDRWTSFCYSHPSYDKVILLMVGGSKKHYLYQHFCSKWLHICEKICHNDTQATWTRFYRELDDEWAKRLLQYIYYKWKTAA